MKMKRLAGVVVVLCACAGVVFGQAQTSPAAASASGSTTSQTLQRLEHEWVDAWKARDTEKLASILADDWVGLGYAGSKATKQTYLEAIKSGKETVQTLQFGPMDVKVLGNVAVVQGTDTETGTYDGKPSSGKYAWTDVFVKRDGKWVAVRSQAAQIK